MWLISPSSAVSPVHFIGAPRTLPSEEMVRATIHLLPSEPNWWVPGSKATGVSWAQSVSCTRGSVAEDSGGMERDSCVSSLLHPPESGIGVAGGSGAHPGRGGRDGGEPPMASVAISCTLMGYPLERSVVSPVTPGEKTRHLWIAFQSGGVRAPSTL